MLLESTEELNKVETKAKFFHPEAVVKDVNLLQERVFLQPIPGLSLPMFLKGFSLIPKTSVSFPIPQVV